MGNRTAASIAGLAAGLSLSLLALGCRPPEPALRADEADTAEASSSATLFAPGVVSTEAPEFAITFEPDGRRAYFNRTTADRSRIGLVAAALVGGRWQDQGELVFAGAHRDVDPFVTADGSRLYFSSDRPDPAAEVAPGFDIWYVERRNGGGWGEPRPLGPPVNSPATEVFCSLSAAGTIYYGSNRDGVFDVYRAPPRDGGFGEPERLNLTLDEDASAGNPWVAADESFVLFSSERPGGLGGSDLWVSFQRDGAWSEPLNLGPAVNSPQADFAPALSPDGRTLFFTSERPGVVAETAIGERPPGDIYELELAPVLSALRAPAP